MEVSLILSHCAQVFKAWKQVCLSWVLLETTASLSGLSYEGTNSIYWICAVSGSVKHWEESLPSRICTIIRKCPGKDGPSRISEILASSLEILPATMFLLKQAVTEKPEADGCPHGAQKESPNEKLSKSTNWILGLGLIKMNWVVSVPGK